MKISDVCEVEFRKQIPEKNKSIVACSFFLMRESYKDITTYLNGLNQLNDTILEQGSSYNPPIYLRVYHDMSVLYSKDPRVIEVMKKLENNPNVELVLYKPRQYVNDSDYAGFFGIIMRYLSYFTFEDNDVDYTYVVDIDFTEKQSELKHAKFLYDTLNKVREDKIDFIYENSICYIPFWKTRISNNPYIVLGNMNGGRGKVDPKILKEFLEDFPRKESKNPLIHNFKVSYLTYLLEQKNSNMIKKKMISFNQDSTFVYGFDEFFFTYFFFPAILEQSGVKVMIHTRNSYGGIGLVLIRCFDRFIENIHRERDLKVLHFYYHLLKTIYDVKNNGGNNRINNAVVKGTENRETMVEYISTEFPKFIEYFRYHDYEGKDMNKHRVYEKLHRIIKKQMELDPRVLGINTRSRTFQCLLENDKYYYHDNSNEILDDTKKHKILKSLLSNINSMNKNNKKNNNKKNNKKTNLNTKKNNKKNNKKSNNKKEKERRISHSKKNMNLTNEINTQKKKKNKRKITRKTRKETQTNEK